MNVVADATLASKNDDSARPLNKKILTQPCQSFVLVRHEVITGELCNLCYITELVVGGEFW